VALVDVELACSIAVALEQFWVTTSPHEGARRLGELLETGAELPKRLRARALRVRGGTNYIAGNFEDASRWHAEALALFRELEDEPAISHMFFRLAVEAWRAGDPERARALCRESLSLHHSVTGEAQTLWLLGDVAFQEGRLEEAFDLLERSARQAGEVGFVWWQLQTLLSYAEYAILVEKPDLAAAPAHEGLELARQIDDRRGMVFGLALHAWLAAAVQGRSEDSGRLWGAAEAAAGRAPVGRSDTGSTSATPTRLGSSPTRRSSSAAANEDGGSRSSRRSTRRSR
jgi:tetratricopeptide (TPR) repeat protein